MTDSRLTPARIQQAIDTKTKPLGALGKIEALAAQIAHIQQTLKPVVETCSLTIFAADHGITDAGVSAYPQTVTQQMVLNFLSGGAAANVFARSLGVELQVVDAGVAGDPIDHPALINRRIAAGTANSLTQRAMTDAYYDAALDAGQVIGESLSSNAVCFGEMGIGNTASASLVASKIIGLPVADLTGRGTGLDDAGLVRKTEILGRAAERTPPQIPASEALIHFGGFEIVMMAGAMIGAARTRRIILVDGFIASVAALAAQSLKPESTPYMVFAHHSAEAGHARVLDALKAEPLLDLGMRLGEGTGALLAWPLVKSAAAMLRDMASFDDAGVSGPQ